MVLAKNIPALQMELRSIYQLEEKVIGFNYLGSQVAENVRCDGEIRIEYEQ